MKDGRLEDTMLTNPPVFYDLCVARRGPNFYLPWGRVSSLKAVVATFNQERALVGALSLVSDYTTLPINRLQL